VDRFRRTVWIDVRLRDDACPGAPQIYALEDGPPPPQILVESIGPREGLARLDLGWLRTLLQNLSPRKNITYMKSKSRDLI
jgi:hypothetical protein